MRTAVPVSHKGFVIARRVRTRYEGSRDVLGTCPVSGHGASWVDYKRSSIDQGRWAALVTDSLRQVCLQPRSGFLLRQHLLQHSIKPPPGGECVAQWHAVGAYIGPWPSGMEGFFVAVFPFPSRLKLARAFSCGCPQRYSRGLPPTPTFCPAQLCHTTVSVQSEEGKRHRLRLATSSVHLSHRKSLQDQITRPNNASTKQEVG